MAASRIGRTARMKCSYLGNRSGTKPLPKNNGKGQVRLNQNYLTFTLGNTRTKYPTLLFIVDFLCFERPFVLAKPA